MKKFVAGAVLGFLASWGVSFAATNYGHNGIFWNKLNDSAKDGYVNGYSDAMRVSVGHLDSLMTAADIFHWKGGHKFIGQVKKQLTSADMGPEATIKRLDEFYSNQKYTELDLGQALQALTVRANETALPPEAPPAKK
jgi:hypothetical protein